ncbi:hypothetical protein Pyn_16943 [Prunus yedoensis var. nudiflora]|uniref:Uncharacterized protein n=1 Tax=Prunus yedoensis var. nudiflora TaxID=2094558 RepID=A0A314V2N8_PRUYE|nr:hypothetical protein Pyn_16943 [Prunus yedoensis var. nudiflora]
MVGNFIWSLLVDSESSESLYSSSVEASSEGDKEEVNQTESEFEPPILESEFELEPMEDKIRKLKKKYETNVWGSGEGSFVLGGLSEEYKCKTCACLRELRLLEGCFGSIEEPKRSEFKEGWKKLHIA